MIIPPPSVEAYPVVDAVLQLREQRQIEERGAINFGELGRAGLTRAGIAIEGLRVFISDRRMDLAGRRLERMDHKIALYSDLGVLATTGQRIETPTPGDIPGMPQPAMPRSIVERFLDHRLDKKASRQSFAATRAYGAVKVFGPSESLPGLNKSERRHEKHLVGRQARRGSILATEARIARTKVDAQPLKLGAQMHHEATKEYRKTTNDLNDAVRKRFSSPYRSWRRNEATKDIQRHYANAEKHRALRQELRDQL